MARTTPAHVVASCTGTLARADVFSANYPLLVTMARSIGPNQEVVMARWKANSDRIMAASRTSSETVDLVISTVDSQMRRDPYAAYNEYLRGEQTVRSDYDGGTYTVDSDVDTDTAVDPRDGQSGLHRVPADPNADRRFVDPSGSYDY